MSCVDNRTPGCISSANTPISFAPAIGEDHFRRIQNCMALDSCKWDSQVGDVCTLFQQPLLVDSQAWKDLERMAEALAAELALAEQELLDRPDLHATLGLPSRLRSVFEEARRSGATPSAARTLRFDFHYTREGWRISEVNSDVPGGYTEASCFTELAAGYFPDTKPAGNPTQQWTAAMVAQEQSRIALLSAPGFLEDQQVTAFLAGQLETRGVETFLLHHPAQLIWRSGRAHVVAEGGELGIDSVVRFYQGEWLARLNGSSGWKWLFAKGRTPVANPGTALLTESKRLPLVWDELSCAMTTWRTLLPECCDPTEADWETADQWVLKLAFSNTGDAVHMRESSGRAQWLKLCAIVKRHPEHWVVQRRFEPLAVASEVGPVYPCIGVYTINGRAAGAYVRATTRQIIDYAAMDVALLIRNESEPQF